MEAVQLEKEVPETVPKYEDARSMTAGIAGRVSEDIAAETEKLSKLSENKTSERKLCDTLTPGVDSVETEELKTLPESETSERKLCDTLCAGVGSVERERLSAFSENEVEVRLRDAHFAVVDSVETEIEDTL